MSKLIILRGNSGSGKTSVAKELQRQIGRNTLILPQDTVRREMLWAKDGY
ncbi:MAG: zeta toxin family protein, partial [Acetatifactor sp.]|nr:zeta toxin family protein [Acetatifactor sp.]